MLTQTLLLLILAAPADLPSASTCPDVLRLTPPECRPYRRAKIQTIAGWSLFGLSVLAGVALPVTFADRGVNPWIGVALALPLHATGFGLALDGTVKASKRRNPARLALSPVGFTLRW